MPEKLPPTNPDPDSNYLSKYIVDFNQRELNKFLHPDKSPQAALSIAALGIVLFLGVAWMFPLKSHFFNQSSQSPTQAAAPEKDQQNMTLSAPQTVKVGEKFTVVVSVRSDKHSGNHLGVNIKYPTDLVDLWEVKELDTDLKNNSGSTEATSGAVMLDLRYAQGFQTDGKSTDLVALTFQAKQVGRVNILLDEIGTFLRDSGNNNLPFYKNNVSILITQ